MTKPIVIACANHKGGSGKTTTVSSLIAALSEMGYNVLGIDGDMQRNLTTTYGLRDTPEEKCLHRAIEDIDKIDNYRGTDYIVKTTYDNIDFIPAHKNMAFLEMNLTLKLAEREKYMLKLIESIEQESKYDYIIIDTNPSIGILNLNIFIASDYLIIPVECSSYGIDGLEDIFTFYKQNKKINKDLEIAGILMCKADFRKSITSEAIEVVRSVFDDLLFDTHIGVDTNIEKSQWDREPILMHSPNTRISKQYKDLAEEVVNVVSKKETAQR